MSVNMTRILALGICLLWSVDAAINSINNNNNNQQQQQQPQQFGTFHQGVPFSTAAQTSTSTLSASSNNNINNNNNNNRKKQDSMDTGVLERFTHRYPDGSYEFRYELSDGTARYERGYFLIFDKVKTLVVVGYYSYRMPDGRYITVFYNADQNGYRQNQSITPQTYPNLPRTIEVPQLKNEQEYSSAATTTANPRIQPITTRRGYF